MAIAIHSVLYTQSLPAYCQKAHYDKHYEKDNWKEIIIYINTSTATTAVSEVITLRLSHSIHTYTHVS